MSVRKIRVLLPDAAYLRSCFRYNKRTGILIWKKRPREHFATQRAFGMWNARYAGKEALTAVNTYGHLAGTLDNKKYVAHRVIWKLVTGQEPPHLIDHRNRKPSDNRWRNFRAATKGQNNINSSLSRGVSFDKSRGKWAAYTKLNGRKIFLGRHETERAARLARISGVRELFGDFAP